MKDFRYLCCKDAYMVLAVWWYVSGERVHDYKSAVKLVKCLDGEVDDWKVSDAGSRMKLVEEYLNWLWRNGKKFSNAWRYISKYMIDRRVSSEVAEVVDAYRMYVKERFGENIWVDISKKEVMQAARVVRNVAKEMGLSVYEVIKYQHECWDKITRPLVFERMADADKVKRRVSIKLEEDMRNGVVVGRSSVSSFSDKEELVARYWKNILSTGVMFYINKKGWLAEIAREYWKQLKSVGSNMELRNELKQQYSKVNIVKRWRESGCPEVLLD